MKKTKETIKTLGKKIQMSNVPHQNDLREHLRTLSAEKEVKTKNKFWKPMIFSFTGVMAVIILAVSLQPSTSSKYNDSYDGVIRSTSEPSALSTAVVESEYDDLGSDPLLYDQGPSAQGIIDYQEEHGAMIEYSYGFRILIRDDEVRDQIIELYTSVGGYISSSNNNYIVGEIPVQSVSLFEERLNEFAKQEKYILKTSSAQNITAEAIAADELIDSLKESISRLEEELANASGSEEERLKRQLEQLNNRLENTKENREEIDSRVDFVTVSVTITELPGLLQANDYNDLEQIFSGYNDPGFATKILINILFVIIWFITLLSFTFWLVIPFGWWIWKRKKINKQLQELE